MNVTPLPAIGDVVAGRDVAGRELRISGHPESDRVVLSIWQSGHCLATVRLARADVPEVTRALVTGLVPLPHARGQAGPSGRSRPGRTVHELHPGDADDGPPGQLTDRLNTAVTNLLSGLGNRLRRFGTRD